MISREVEATRRIGSNGTPRSFACPDGMTRVIVLSNEAWVALDYLAEHHDLNVDGLIKTCWEDAQNNQHVEYQFRALLEYDIRFALSRMKGDEQGVANDNLKDNPYWPPFLRSQFATAAAPCPPTD